MRSEGLGSAKKGLILFVKNSFLLHKVTQLVIFGEGRSSVVPFVMI